MLEEFALGPDGALLGSSGQAVGEPKVAFTVVGVILIVYDVFMLAASFSRRLCASLFSKSI